MSVVVALSLLHFLWQGAVIGAAAWVAMKIARTASARYAIGVAALLVMAMAPVMTGIWGRNSVVPGPEFRVPGSSGVPGLSGVPESVQFVQNSGRTPDPGTGTRNSALGTLDTLRAFVRVSPTLAKWLLGSWLLGVALLSVRLSLGLWTARRLTRTLVSQPRLEILSNAERLMAKLNIRGAVTVLESALVQVPTAMGWLKPVVLLPAQAMTGLSMAQIDALVAHELAHIKRHDYLVNLLQSAIETLLFYHPAVWLLSRRIRHERELCCDDMAIAACGDDRLTYASALADLESLRQEPEPMLAANGGSLLTRVRRILAPDDVQTVRGKGHWMAGIGILLIALIAVPINVSRARASADPGMEEVEAEIGLGPGIKQMLYTQPLTAPPAITRPDVVEPPVPLARKSDVTPDQAKPPIPMLVSATDEPSMKIDSDFDLTVRVVSDGKPVKAFGEKPVKVGPDGKATLPMIGAIRLSGLTIQQASSAIRTELIFRKFFKDPAVDVRVNMEIVEPEPLQIIGPFRVGDDIAIEMGEFRDPESVRVFATVGQNGNVALQKLGEVKIAGRTSDVIAIEIARKLYEANGGKQTVVDVHFDPKSSRNKSETERSDNWTPRVIQSEPQPTIAPGQLLRLEATVGVVRQSEFSKDYTVQPDGSIVLPYVGRTKVAGLTVDAAQEAIRSALAEKGTLPGAKVAASLETPSSGVSVFVTGGVRNPNVYPWRNSLTVSEAIAMAGGATVTTPRVELILDGRVMDTAAASSQGLPAGVTVNVLAPRTGNLKVQGAVNRPGSLDMTAEKMTLTDLLNSAGGLQPSAGSEIRVKRATARAVDSATLVRDGWEIYLRSDLTSGRLANVLLYDNDTVDVPVAPKYFVQGFVVNPGELQWEPNLTLERALLKAGGPTKDAALSRITVKRLDPKTKQYNAIELAKDRMSTLIQVRDVITVPKRRL